MVAFWIGGANDSCRGWGLTGIGSLSIAWKDGDGWLVFIELEWLIEWEWDWHSKSLLMDGRWLIYCRLWDG